MYKLLAFLSLCLLVGCDDYVGGQVNNGNTVHAPNLTTQHYVYQGHNYIMFYGVGDISGVVHDPDCVNPKHNTEPVR